MSNDYENTIVLDSFDFLNFENPSTITYRTSFDCNKAAKNG